MKTAVYDLEVFTTTTTQPARCLETMRNLFLLLTGYLAWGTFLREWLGVLPWALAQLHFDLPGMHGPGHIVSLPLSSM